VKEIISIVPPITRPFFQTSCFGFLSGWFFKEKDDIKLY